MTLKTLIAASLAAAFATLPFAVQAAGDKASAGATKSDGGAEAMFKSMDKNKDGSISKDEAKGTPHDKDFAKLDKNSDGKLSPQEHAAAPEHAGKASAGGSKSK
jgi:Ca2+-binding EF-hand superfamily protein